MAEGGLACKGTAHAICTQQGFAAGGDLMAASGYPHGKLMASQRWASAGAQPATSLEFENLVPFHGVACRAPSGVAPGGIA